MRRVRRSCVPAVLILCVLGAGLSAQTFPAGSQGLEDEQLAILKSDAGLKEKADACRNLSVYGTAKSVPVLAGMLSDEKLAHMARTALEPIADPSVDEALRDALGRLDGRRLVGVIGSVGVRKDAEAIPILVEKLKDSDAQVAQAAARALGSIGGDEAVKALQEGLKSASGETRKHICEGLFRCAEQYAGDRNRRGAIAIYDELRGMDLPHQIRSGAVRGAILARGRRGLDLLREYLGSDDYHLFSAAVQTAQEMRSSRATQALVEALDGASAANRILIVRALGERGDEAALPKLYALAGEGDKAVRVEAIRAIPDVGGTAGQELIPLFGDSDGEVAEAARESFAALDSPQTDMAVMRMFRSDDEAMKLTAMDLMARRRMTAAVPELLKAASQGGDRVRPAALRKIGELGGPEQVTALVRLLGSLESGQDRTAAEQALRSICTDALYRDACRDRLTAAMAGANATQRAAVVRVLGAVGGSQALEAVRTALKDEDEQVRSAAFQTLTSWGSFEAAPDLLAIARTADERSQQIAALRGYIRLCRDKGLSTQEQLRACRDAAALAERPEEKKLLLGVLGTVESPEALELITPHLEEAATREEAAAAGVAVADKLLGGKTAEQVRGELVEPLTKIAAATQNADLKNRAQTLLAQAKK